MCEAKGPWWKRLICDRGLHGCLRTPELSHWMLSSPGAFLDTAEETLCRNSDLSKVTARKWDNPNKKSGYFCFLCDHFSPSVPPLLSPLPLSNPDLAMLSYCWADLLTAHGGGKAAMRNSRLWLCFFSVVDLMLSSCALTISSEISATPVIQNALWWSQQGKKRRALAWASWDRTIVGWL